MRQKENDLERSIHVDKAEYAAELFGSFDVNAKRLEKAFGVTFSCRDSQIHVIGEEPGVSRAVRAAESLLRLVEKGEVLNDQNVGYCIDMVMEDSEAQMAPLTDGCICITAKGKPVKPKTVGQKNYCDNIRNNTITIGVGPAGTGKTYLAVAMAVTAFRAQQVNRIILTRPAVEAGEKLGFLPGDLQQKVDPYLRPLYDALFDMLGAESYARLVERGSIEVAPLAYMRGRTLDDSFIILDEAQNTTCEQMKMFLTRLGFNSKMVITGDITQIDLPDGRRSGLKDAMRVLRNVDDISVFRFTEKTLCAIAWCRISFGRMKKRPQQNNPYRKDFSIWKKSESSSQTTRKRSKCRPACACSSVAVATRFCGWRSLRIPLKSA